MSNNIGLPGQPEWWEQDTEERSTEDCAKDFQDRMHTFYNREDGSSAEAEVDDGLGDDPSAGRQAANDDVYDAEFEDFAGFEDEPEEVSSAGSFAEQERAAQTAGAYDDIPEKHMEYIASYNGVIDEWEKEGSSDNAFEVERMKAARQELIGHLAENSLMGHPALQGKEAYLAADIAENNRPDVADGEYANFLRRRTLMRDQVFGEEVEIDADVYANAIGRTKAMMNRGIDIKDQYDLLDVRRDAVLEHWDDPQFIAQVARHEDNHLRDELMSDFDRADLETQDGMKRSEVYSDVFRERIETRVDVNKPTSLKVRDFIELREMATEMKSDQGAIMDFVRKTEGFEQERGFKKDLASSGVGMAALEGTQFSPAVLQEFWASFPEEERAGVVSETKNDVGKLFSRARKKFDEDFTAGNQSAVLSFAVMERAAAKLIKMDAHSHNMALKDLEDIQALQQFDPKLKKEARDRAQQQFESQVNARLKERGLLNEERRAVHEKDVYSFQDDAGVSKTFSIEKGDEPIINVVDGSHIQISKWKKEFEAEGLLAKAGLGEEAFAEVSSGALSPKDFIEKAQKSGVSSEKLEQIGIKPSFLAELSGKGEAQAGKDAFRNLGMEGYEFRLKNIVTPPPDEVQTTDGKFDVGVEAKSQLEKLLRKHDDAGLNFKFEDSKDGKEKLVSIELTNGLDLSDEMLRTGHAVPLSGEAGTRQEKIAQFSEAHRRGLWKNGIPEEDSSWRRDFRSPLLSATDKKEKLTQTVAASMAGSAAHAGRMLSQKETQLFALPLEEWSRMPNVDREISRITKSNPSRVKKIYANNMEILNDLRERNKKGSLTDEEKLAHDRLSIGRRAMAESLVEYGHMTPEEAMKDSHKLLSRKSQFLSKGFREKFVKGAEKVTEATSSSVKMAGRGAQNLAKSAIDTFSGEGYSM